MIEPKPSAGAGGAASSARLDAVALAPLLFLVSGATAMLYQLAAFRGLVELYGSSSSALGAVVAAFLACLAIGSFGVSALADRVARPLRAYAKLEALAGIGGLLGFWALDRLDGVADRLAIVARDGGPVTLLRFAVAFAWMLVPVGALGGTLPLLARFRLEEKGRARAAGVLQAFNTFGAVLGVTLAGRLLLAEWGVRNTVLAAASTNLCLAFAAWLLGGAAAPAPAPMDARDTRGTAEERGSRTSPFLLVSFLLGVCTAGAEVLFFRGLAPISRGSVDSVAMLLSAFLAANALGTAVGTGIAARGARVASTHLVLSLGGVTVGVVLGTMLLFDIASGTPMALLRSGLEASSDRGRWLGEALAALAVVGPVAFALGLPFPSLCRAPVRRPQGFGRWVGLLSGAWTLGAAVGGLLVPRALLGRPGVGLEDGLFLLALLPLLALLVLALGEGRRILAGRIPWFAFTAIAGVVLLALPAAGNFGRRPLQFYRMGLAPGSELIGYGEGASASVAVVQHRSGQKQLEVNDLLSLGGGGSARVENFQAALPALLQGAAHDALVLGVGSGITVGALAQCGVPKIDAVELLPEVLNAVGLFSAENNALPFLAERGQVRLHAQDARTFVRAAEPGSYDLVIGDLFFPWLSEAGFLYTEEHFRRVASLLREDGLFCQWLPLHQLRWEEFGIVGRTFSQVFPGATVWLASIDFPFPVVALIGGRTPMVLDPTVIAERLGTFYGHDLLAEQGVDQLEPFLSLYLADEFLFRNERNFSRQDQNTTDRPLVEFECARRMESEGVVALQNRERLYEVKEDVVGRMTTASLQAKERVPLQQRLSLASKVAAERFRAVSLRMAAEANRALPESQRQNDPEALEAEAFHVLGLAAVTAPKDEAVADSLHRLLADRLRGGHYPEVAGAIDSLLSRSLDLDTPRLRNLRGMAHLFTYCDPKQSSAIPNALDLAVDDFAAAHQADPEQVEWATNFGVAAFLAARSKAALETLHDARQRIRVGGGGESRLPTVAEAIYQYLSGERERALELLEQTPSFVVYREKVWERMQG